MKTRVISAVIALLIFIPILLLGGSLFNMFIYILSLCSLYELIKVRSMKKDLPIFIKVISFLIITGLFFSNIGNTTFQYNIDIRMMSSIFLIFLIPVVLYHNSKLYSINDAFYLMGSVFFIGISFSIFVLLRTINIELIIYLLLITICTDTYAYSIGKLIGKNKLIEVISPNKTWEGMIAGTFFGTFVATCFLYFVIEPNISIYYMILITLFLSIIAQLGDLVLSAIKRYFNVKDFSNIMPGHGGILDRLDSMIFVSLTFILFYTLF